MSKFKVGDVVRTDDKTIIGYAVDSGYNPERLKVVRLDHRGYPVLAWESDKAYGWRPDLLDLVSVPLTNNFYVIKRFARDERPHPVRASSLDEAKQWIVEHGKEGEEYHIQESIKHGPFRVDSKTVNTLAEV